MHSATNAAAQIAPSAQPSMRRAAGTRDAQLERHERERRAHRPTHSIVRHGSSANVPQNATSTPAPTRAPAPASTATRRERAPNSQPTARESRPARARAKPEAARVTDAQLRTQHQTGVQRDDRDRGEVRLHHAHDHLARADEPGPAEQRASGSAPRRAPTRRAWRLAVGVAQTVEAARPPEPLLRARDALRSMAQNASSPSSTRPAARRTARQSPARRTARAGARGPDHGSRNSPNPASSSQSQTPMRTQARNPLAGVYPRRRPRKAALHREAAKNAPRAPHGGRSIADPPLRARAQAADVWWLHPAAQEYNPALHGRSSRSLIEWHRAGASRRRSIA